MARKATKPKQKVKISEVSRIVARVRRKATRGTRPKRKAPSTAFKSRPEGSGRKKGQPNILTRELKEAIVTAAAMHGEDGKGKNELIGYLFRLAKNKDPYLFTGLLKAIIPLQVQMGGTPQEKPYQSAEEVRAELERRGLPKQTIYRLEHSPGTTAEDAEVLAEAIEQP
jgi:hypothetical protein